LTSFLRLASGIDELEVKHELDCASYHIPLVVQHLHCADHSRTTSPLDKFPQPYPWTNTLRSCGCVLHFALSAWLHRIIGVRLVAWVLFRLLCLFKLASSSLPLALLRVHRCSQAPNLHYKQLNAGRSHAKAQWKSSRTWTSLVKKSGRGAFV
jgi:hypothetical protein